MNHDIRCEGLKIVTIGGGTGTSSLLEGLKKYTDNITCVVTVTDTGRSSGMIRKDLQVLSPGDIRNCLIALSNSEKLLCDLFQYRFENGALEGHSFGNLFIAALAKVTGSFEKAIEEASKILQLKGKVLPATFDIVNICAELADGTYLQEENEIIDRHNSQVHLRSRIKRVFHEPQARVNPSVVKAIAEADIIIICPGSLYTSVIGNLLIGELCTAVNDSKAKKIYVCNIMTQVSQTHGYTASDHVKEVLKYLDGTVDYVLINTKLPDKRLLAEYEKEHASIVTNDFSELEKLSVKIVADSLLDESSARKLLWEKKDLLRHDPDKVARLIMQLVC